MNAFLRELREQEWFVKFVQDLAKDAPTIRAYDPSDPHSTAKWQADSWKRQGYLLALTKLGFSLEELSGD